jgi:glycerol-3-phosphate O-acyltransferase / dihydroxyacetone phosphate acyltransferase
MILYRVLRAFGRLALRWFYSDVEVDGIEHLPSQGPALLASNHPNALVDALVIGCTLRRPVTLTAKATLLENPISRCLLRSVGVVPLRRASDDANRARGEALDPSRNAAAFTAVLDALQAGRAVLLFPEGKSHSAPELAPLKTGLARMALMARDERQITALPVIPIGLTFERKWDPRSRVLMHIGAPISIDELEPNADQVAVLTARVNTGLREVTLNFPSAEDAERILALSNVLAEVFDEFRPLGAPDPPLAESVKLAHRINTIAPRLRDLDPAITARVETFLNRFAAFEHATQQHTIAASDVQMSTALGPGAWFTVRELLIAAVAGPLALWGRMNHWAPLRLARLLGKRTSRTPDEPAMNTIVAGLVLVLLFYAGQTTLVGWLFGWWIAIAYAISLPFSATWDIRYADRRRRAASRIRTYLLFRRDRELHEQLLAELNWLRREAVELNASLTPTFGHLEGVKSA